MNFEEEMGSDLWELEMWMKDESHTSAEKNVKTKPPEKKVPVEKAKTAEKIKPIEKDFTTENVQA